MAVTSGPGGPRAAGTGRPPRGLDGWQLYVIVSCLSACSAVSLVTRRAQAASHGVTLAFHTHNLTPSPDSDSVAARSRLFISLSR